MYYSVGTLYARTTKICKKIWFPSLVLLLQRFYESVREEWETGRYADVQVVCSDGSVSANSCLLSAGGTFML